LYRYALQLATSDSVLCHDEARVLRQIRELHNVTDAQVDSVLHSLQLDQNKLARMFSAAQPNGILASARSVNNVQQAQQSAAPRGLESECVFCCDARATQAIVDVSCLEEESERQIQTENRTG
jgi:hypothetical protein